MEKLGTIAAGIFLTFACAFKPTTSKEPGLTTDCYILSYPLMQVTIYSMASAMPMA
jgi:hypothetical protein